MTTPALPLKTLAERLAQHQAELEALRQEFQARQTRLADLTQRKTEMESQLQQLELEIQAITQGTVSTAPAPAAPAHQAQSTPPSKRKRRSPLADLLVQLVQRADGPVTVKELAAEVQRRKFPTRSKNIAHLIQTVLQRLIALGVLQRAPGHPGVVPAKAKSEKELPATRAIVSQKEKESPEAAPRPGPGEPKKPSLQAVLTDLLTKSKQPLKVRELAEQVLAQGYATQSKDFTHVVRVMLGKMENVQLVPDQGYQLKKR